MQPGPVLITIERAANYVNGNNELGERQHLFSISDESIDDYNTVFFLNGWDLSRRKMKKRVTYGHPSYSDLDDTNIIGIGEESISDKLYSILTLEPETANPKAQRIHEKLLFGSLTDASIRGYAIDGRQGREDLNEDPSVFYFTNTQLVDWGVVMEGSNFNATKERQANERAAIENFIKSRVKNRYHDKIEFLKAMKVRYYI